MSVIYEYLKKINSHAPKEFQPKISLFRRTSIKKRSKNLFLLTILLLILIGGLLYIFIFRHSFDYMILHKNRPIQNTLVSGTLSKNRSPRHFTWKSKSISPIVIKTFRKEDKNFVLELKKKLKEKKEKPNRKKKNKKIKKQMLGNKINKKVMSSYHISNKNNLLKSSKDPFYIKSQRNSKVIIINRKLKKLFLSNDLTQFEKVLNKLASIAGENSIIVLKWEGLLAYRQKKYNKARAIFSTILERSPFSKDIRINLIFTLLCLKQKELARKEFIKLQRAFPFDKEVQMLNAYFRD